MDATFNPNLDLSQTFGIELELLCLRPDTLFSGTPMCDIVLTALREAGVPVSNHTCMDIGGLTPAPFSEWRVEEEVLELTPEEQALLPAGYSADPIEMVSRKFSHALDNWQGEIAAVLTVLQNLETQCGVKFMTNRSCGFHVHVGQLDGTPLPLRTAKNLYLLTTAFESSLDALHAAHRIAIPWDAKERQHCWPLSFFATKQNHGGNVFERFLHIEHLTSYEELGGCFFLDSEDMAGREECTGHNSAINFDNLFPDEDMGRHQETLTGTIEFRQHAATLDLETICAWVQLTTGMVRFASRAMQQKPGQFVDLLANALSEEMNIDALLALLDIPDVATNTHYYAVSSGRYVLPAPLLTPAHAPLLPLVAATWAAAAASTSRQAVDAVIEEKASQGVYGNDPNLTAFKLHDKAVEDSWWHMEREKFIAGQYLETWDPEELSRVMAAFFKTLSADYEMALRSARER